MDGLAELQRKIIGETTQFISSGENTIDCIRVNIRNEDIDCYKTNYNIQAYLYRDLSLFGKSIQWHFSSPKSIHVKTQLNEKNKIKISEITVPEEIKDPDADNFYVDLKIENMGEFDADINVYVDMIERPSAIPDLLEGIIDLGGFATVRKQLGLEKDTINSNGCKDLTVNCKLRESEKKLKKFNIEATLFVEIDDVEYKVDSSKLYEIMHEQPICYEEGCILLIVGAVFIGLIGFLIIVLIIRILYPMYYIKKADLKERKDIIKKKRK